MANNVVTLQNKTPLPVEISMYVASDASVFSSVIWRQTTVPPNAGGLIQWDDSTDVVLASFDEEKSVFTPFQLEVADPGTLWSINKNEEGQLVIGRDGNAAQPDQIEIRNQSGMMVNAGLGIGGDGVTYKKNIYSGLMLLFNLQAFRYWITVTALAAQGQLLPTVKMLSAPQEVAFPPLLPAALVTILQRGASSS